MFVAFGLQARDPGQSQSVGQFCLTICLIRHRHFQTSNVHGYVELLIAGSPLTCLLCRLDRFLKFLCGATPADLLAKAQNNFKLISKPEAVKC